MSAETKSGRAATAPNNGDIGGLYGSSRSPGDQILRPVPKPPRTKRPRKRMKPRNAKRQGSAFPKVRDKKYRDWVRLENPCMLRGATIRVPFSTHDFPLPAWGYIHECWGDMTPAHVGDHQARGAPDFGVIVPLCQAAHQYYDEHRDEWERVTRYSEKQMALAASGYALRYVEQGGVPVSQKEQA